MALDLHSKVTVGNILETQITREGYVFLKVAYKVKRGRKLYTLWALPEDLRDCGIFPLCYNQAGEVLTMTNKVIYTGTVKQCKRFVIFANRRYYTGQ